MEHAPCTLGGVKSDRAHFVGGGRHNLLLRALRLIYILNKNLFFFLFRLFLAYDMKTFIFRFYVPFFPFSCFLRRHRPQNRNLGCRCLERNRDPKMCAVRESNPGLVRGRDLYYHCTNGAILVPRIELGTSRVLGERHNQLDHTS